MRRINQLRMGVIMTYINMGIGTLIPMFYTPIMLNILGKSEYGLYSLSSSVIGYLSLLNFGLGGTIVRYISKYRAENKKLELEKMAGMSILIYTVLASIVFLCGLILRANVDLVFDTGLSLNELDKMRTLVLLMSINTAISFPISVFSSIIVAYERYIYRQLVDILATIVVPCINIIVLFSGYGSIGLAAVSTIVQAAMLPLYMVYCYRSISVRPKFTNLPFHLLKEIGVFSVFIFIGSIVDMLFWATDKVLLGMLSGTATVAVYNLGAQFNQMLTSLSTAFSGVLTPRTTAMVAKKASRKELSDLFIRVGRLQYIIIALALSGFIVFGKDFILLWAGEGYTAVYSIALVTMIPLSIPLIQNTGFSILVAENKHKFRSIIYFFIAVINVCATYFVIPYWGPIGAAICSGISYIVGQGIIMNLFYYKNLKLDIPVFWKNILKMSSIPIANVLVYEIILHWVNIDNWLELLIYIILYSITYFVGMYFVVFNAYEKNIVNGIFEKITRKK